MIDIFPWLFLAVIALAIISLIKQPWMPILIAVAVLILGMIGALSGFHR